MNRQANVALHKEAEMPNSVALHTTWSQGMVTVPEYIQSEFMSEVVHIDLFLSFDGLTYHHQRVGYAQSRCKSWLHFPGRSADWIKREILE